MPQIPRQFLQRPQQGSVGRRDRQIAQTQPGVADQVDAIIAATRGLDFTPIGESLYRTGSVFAQMERERLAAEDELKKMKQMSAARSVIINTTQKIHDAYAEIKTMNLSDPEETRNLFHQKVQGVMDEDQQLLDEIGEYAFEPYTRHITETMTTLQPRLTEQAIGNSKMMLEEQLREQRRTVIGMMGKIEDDDEAGRMGTLMFSAIIDETYPFLSDVDRKAQAKAFMAEAVTERFRMKWTNNPKGALAYFNAQTGLDDEVRHKIYATVVSESASFNAALENQQQLQDRMTDKLRTERFQQIQADLTQAIQSGNEQKISEIYNDRISDPTSLEPSHQTFLLNMITSHQDGSDRAKGPSDGMVLFTDYVNNQPLHIAESWLYANAAQFNNAEKIDALNMIRMKKTKDGEASLALEKSIFSNVEDRLLALQILNPETMTKEEKLQLYEPGGRETMMNNLSKDAKEKLAMLRRDLKTAINGARYTNSPTGNNYANLEKRAGEIEDIIYRQYAGAFKNPKERPAPFSMDLRSAKNMLLAGQLPLADYQNMYKNYLTNQKAKDPNYDPKNDPVLIEASEQQKAAKQGAVGAAGGRNMEPPKEQPERPLAHAGILPDLPPVKQVAIGRTVGRNTDDPKFDEYVNQYGIGAQAIAEESGGRAWSVGKESDGTRSYGIYQINERNMNEFMAHLRTAAPEAAAKLKGKPASPGFNRAWEKLGKSGDAAFIKAQQDYITQEMYAPAISAFEQEFGIERGNLPPAIHMAVFSSSVQHGGVKKIIKAAAQKLGQPDLATPQQILQAIYEARNEYVQKLDSLSPEWKAELSERYQREYQRGLKYLG